jgi:hypothetical protein
MEVSDQLHVPAALPPGKEPPVFRERKGTLDKHNQENNTPMKYRNNRISKKTRRSKHQLRNEKMIVD